MANRMPAWMTTRHCADRLGVSTGFVVGEIKAGRLHGHQLLREGKRPFYRIAPSAFAAYVSTHWRRASLSAQTPQNARNA